MKHFNDMRIISNRQQGMTTIGLLLLLVVIALFALSAIRIIPIYMENFAIKSVLTAVQDDQRIDAKSKAAIWDSLKKRLYINEVRLIKREHVGISRENSQTTVTITYESRRPYIGPLFIGGSFSESVVIAR
jgi:Tfp pilus assembly major pilin PilA